MLQLQQLRNLEIRTVTELLAARHNRRRGLDLCTTRKLFLQAEKLHGVLTQQARLSCSRLATRPNQRTNPVLAQWKGIVRSQHHPLRPHRLNQKLQRAGVEHRSEEH